MDFSWIAVINGERSSSSLMKPNILILFNFVQRFSM